MSDTEPWRSPRVEPERYAEQLAEKQAYVEKTFAAFTTPTLEVYPSPSSHYRQRCEFRIWHEDDDLFYAMFEVDLG